MKSKQISKLAQCLYSRPQGFTICPCVEGKVLSSQYTHTHRYCIPNPPAPSPIRQPKTCSLHIPGKYAETTGQKKKDGFQWPILYIILVQGGEERKKRGAALAAFMLREIVNHPSGYIQHHFKFSAGVVTKSIRAAWP